MFFYKINYLAKQFAFIQRFFVPGEADQIGADMWDYQACTEMIMPMCFDGIADMFEKGLQDISTPDFSTPAFSTMNFSTLWLKNSIFFWLERKKEHLPGQ